MNGQLSCEGPYGLNVLKEIHGPQCRELPKTVDPATVMNTMYPARE